MIAGGCHRANCGLGHVSANRDTSDRGRGACSSFASGPVRAGLCAKCATKLYMTRQSMQKLNGVVIDLVNGNFRLGQVTNLTSYCPISSEREAKAGC